MHETQLAFESVDFVDSVDSRTAKVVELRFFGRLESEAVAEALGLSVATVKRDWTIAIAWLQRELSAS